MIHYWECDRCTHSWTSCCFGSMMLSEKEKVQYRRQLWSGVCHDCFEQLEAEEISGLEVFDLLFSLREKLDRLGQKSQLSEKVMQRVFEKHDYYPINSYSTMCHEFELDRKEPEKGSYVSGSTFEQDELHKVVQGVEEAFKAAILQQRTEKRIELDEWRVKNDVGLFFGPRPKPEGFEGDPAGKVRTKMLFGFDPASGDIIAPTIITEDGNG